MNDDRAQQMPSAPVTEEVRDEIVRRLQTYEQDKAAARPWTDVRAQLLQRVPQA